VGGEFLELRVKLRGPYMLAGMALEEWLADLWEYREEAETVGRFALSA
jgi:hypothetical protein